MSPTGGHAVYRDISYIGPLQSGDWLEYRDIDFGTPAKYDHFAIGLTKVWGDVSIEVHLDEPEGECIAIITHGQDYDGIWRYFSTPMRPVTGIHHLYLVVKGTGVLSMSCFKAYHASYGGAAVVSIQGAGGTLASKSILRLNWDAKMPKLTFETGPQETEVVVSITNSSKYYIYLDDVGLWNPSLGE